jgi:Uncharacterized conserved protein
MDGISLMVDEHKNIKRMLLVVRKACFRILQGDDIAYDDFSKIIDFVRTYADNHHHGKEEKILFNKMVSEIGGVADKLVNQGMLVEHDLGRLHMRELELALDRVKAGDEESKLDVIANAVSYTHLLSRHIEKEDNTVYTFAQRKLSKETLEQINKECEDFENKAIEDEISKKYISILEELERKYLK